MTEEKDPYKEITENWQTFLKYLELEAKKKWELFNALKRNGFNEQQALEIVKNQ